MAVGVIEQGQVLTPVFTGVRNAETRASMTADTVFEAASLSKPVFAYLCMRLVDQGLLDLDKPLAEIEPNARMAHDERYKKITARLVLSHRTGLPNWGGDKLDLNFDPGTSFGYSGEGYVYLGAVIEKLTGQALGQLFAKEVFGPLQMSHSSFVWQASYTAKASSAHNQLGQVQQDRNRNEKINTAASLYTTVGDYSRFTTAVMAGQGLKPESARAMLTGQGAATFGQEQPQGSGKPMQWALGWGVLPKGKDTVYWHWGDNGNFKAFVLWQAQSKDGLVYFANSSEGHALLGAVVEKMDPVAAKAFTVLGYESFDAPGRTERRAAEDLIEKGNYQQAIKLLDFGLKKHPELEILQRMRAWATDLSVATNRPQKLDKAYMAKLAGKYGPRNLMAGPEQLFYRREGRELYPLIAVGRNTFALDGMFSFRLEVVMDDAGNPTLLKGHYLNGNTDESPRSAD